MSTITITCVIEQEIVPPKAYNNKQYHLVC